MCPVYHFFTRASDRGYNSARARRFAEDVDAEAFAQTLLVDHPIVEVWYGETLVIEVRRDARAS